MLRGIFVGVKKDGTNVFCSCREASDATDEEQNCTANETRCNVPYKLMMPQDWAAA